MVGESLFWRNDMNIVEIQDQLNQQGLDAYVVMHNNRFIGQDILPEEHKLKKLCGFYGSDGLLIITAGRSFLFVDGRYELQADQEVTNADVEIVHQVPNFLNACRFLAERNLHHVGYDAWCISVNQAENVRKKIKNLNLVDIGDLVGEEKPKNVQIFSREARFSGCTAHEKIADLAKWICQNDAQYFLLTSADSVSWLLNIYARDLTYTPVVRVYALVDMNGHCVLFGDHVQTDDLPLYDFRQMENMLAKLNNVRVLYDPEVTPVKMLGMFSEQVELCQAQDLCRMRKAENNPVEIQGMISCHIRDGVALTKLLHWLEKNYKGKTEWDVVEKLHEFRAQQKDFFSESFASIVGSAADGAVVHYQPHEDSSRLLEENNLLLIDSGGQYLDGTTDVTRTIVLGQPSADMKRDFTRVLQAHIALARAKFPEGTAGIKLDTLAREKLWAHGLDYKHGTGHGVGCFGNVHEGPINISLNGSGYGFRENMVTSIEPGYYKKDFYGIRIENLVYTSKVEDTFDGDVNFLMFRCLTKVPLDKKLIDKYLLSAEEQAWLNEYHQSVYDCLTPYLNEVEKRWLKEACSPL